MKTALAKAAKKSDPSLKIKGALRIHQIIKLDLNGDGTEEELISAYSLGGSDMSDMVLGGLFLRNSADPTTFELLESSELEMYEVLGAVDLDNDGNKELILRVFYYEGSAYSIGKLDGSKYIELGSWACGA